MYDRIKAMVKVRGRTIESVANAAGMTLAAYNSTRRKGLALRCDIAYLMAKELGVPMEYFVSGNSVDPPGSIRELLRIAEKLDDSEIAMLLSIAETYLKKKKHDDELEQKPRTKTG